MTTQHLPFSIIACQGVDAQDFLHNQLTQSVNDLGPEHARLFAYCTPQGRVMANGIFWRHAEKVDTFYLMVHNSIAETLLRRLQMYVLRAKVTLELLEETEIVGCNQAVLTGQKDQTAVANNWALPLHWDSQYISIQAPGSADQPTRYWLINLASDEEQSLSIEEQKLIASKNWLLQEIKNGWTWINSQNSDLFIPQNINLDILPAVNFAKGCFPGQEVVARSHYRTTIRKRTVLMSANIGETDSSFVKDDSLVATDVVLLPEENSEQKEARVVGRVSDYVTLKGQMWILVETQLDHILNQSKLALSEYPELLLEHQPLPFEEQLPWEKKK